jgi:hypothetical protein
VITGRLVGDDTVLAWLRGSPDAAASGLARVITGLGIDLQRKLQETELGDQILATRSWSFEPNLSVQIDEGSDRIAANVASDNQFPLARGYRPDSTAHPRGNLRRIKNTLARPISEKTIEIRSFRRRMDIPECSFLHSALEAMDPEIRDNVEDALREALTR